MKLLPPVVFTVSPACAAVAASARRRPEAEGEGSCGGRFMESCVLLLAIFLAGCTSPIGADRVTARESYSQVDANALRTGKVSAETASLLHRYALDELAARHPDAAVRQLHQKALTNGHRDLLFALAELSFVAGRHIDHQVKPWDPRDARDYYLGSAVYSYLFLFGDGPVAKPSAFDRRFREACDFYNYSLGLALRNAKDTNATIRLAHGRRQLPAGTLELRVQETPASSQLTNAESLLLADQYRVRGLSVRNRHAGVGAPILCVGKMDEELGVYRSAPATVFLRVSGTLAEITAGHGTASLEIFSPDTPTIQLGGKEVPLEVDLTTHLAYNLNQSTVWAMGNLQFLAPAERIRSQLILNQPYDPNKIPLVFVHGTFSSPVTWAEMANTLTADSVLRQRFQIWNFLYGSGNPLVKSIAEFRATLEDQVKRLDPTGTNQMLRQMVIVGHSQGGLVTKSTAVSTGDSLWRMVSTNRLEDLLAQDARNAEFHRLVSFEPLPFVGRVVFIATPHRGSYLAGGFARRWAQRLVSLPRDLVESRPDLLRITRGSEIGKFIGGRLPTSLDGMSPRNPSLLAMAELPVLPPIKSHSIIAVRGHGDYHKGKDGLVKYSSAHVAYANSECIVRSFHSCLEQPSTIEEVRRILYEHIAASADAVASQPSVPEKK